MADITLIYDGLCPLCNAYVRHVRLVEAAGGVVLINAREHPEQVAALKLQGIDINRDMVLKMGENTYVGSDCLHMLALLSSRVGWFNKMNARLFLYPRLAKALYPPMRLGRRALLRLLGIPLIDTSR